jgi:hypothetical protein
MMPLARSLASLLPGAALLHCLFGCSSAPQLVLDVNTRPAGAEVYLSRRGEKSYRGTFGPVEGDVSAEPMSYLTARPTAAKVPGYTYNAATPKRSCASTASPAARCSPRASGSGWRTAKAAARC